MVPSFTSQCVVETVDGSGADLSRVFRDSGTSFNQVVRES